MIQDKNLSLIKQDGKFRLQATCFMLTYKTHIDKDLLKTFLEEKLKRENIKKIVMAHETGNGKEYPHTHVLVLLVKQRTVATKPRKFDWEKGDEIIHPHIQKCNAKHWRKIAAYLAKEDPANEDFKDGGVETVVDLPLKEVWAAHTIRDAYVAGNPKRWGDILGIKQAWFDRPPPDVQLDFGELLPWEEEIWKFTEGEGVRATFRKLLWIFDTAGNTGKTTFCKKLLAKDDKVRLIPGHALHKDGAHAIAKWYDSGWGREPNCTLLFDLPRAAEHHLSIYTLVENCLNGLIFSPKYDSRMINTYPIRVIVFANYPPLPNQLSMDRYLVKELGKFGMTAITLKRRSYSWLKEHWRQHVADLQLKGAKIPGALAEFVQEPEPLDIRQDGADYGFMNNNNMLFEGGVANSNNFNV